MYLLSLWFHLWCFLAHPSVPSVFNYYCLLGLVDCVWDFSFCCWKPLWSVFLEWKIRYKCLIFIYLFVHVAGRRDFQCFVIKEHPCRFSDIPWFPTPHWIIPLCEQPREPIIPLYVCVKVAVLWSTPVSSQTASSCLWNGPVSGDHRIDFNLPYSDCSCRVLQ